MKLPKWTEDELILTLYLYHEIKRGEKKNSQGVFTEMSRKLRSLNIFPEHQKNPTFRNSNGISRKLGNFASIDPDYKGKGLYACSEMDRSIFMRFYDKPIELRYAVEHINKKYTENVSSKMRLSWTEEELTLALVLYNTLKYGQMHGRNPGVIALSRILQCLPIYPKDIRPENFRSVASVSLRLSNFRSCDPECNAQGLHSSGAGLFHDIFNKYYKQPQLLANDAKEIEQKYKINILEIRPCADGEYQDVATEEFHNTRGVFRIHKSKEIESTFYNKVRSYHYNQSKECSLCGHNLTLIYGKLGENMMEYHCIKYLSNENSQIVTIGDYVQVCPTCHKLLDKYIGLIDYEDIKNLTEA